MQPKTSIKLKSTVNKISMKILISQSGDASTKATLTLIFKFCHSNQGQEVKLKINIK